MGTRGFAGFVGRGRLAIAYNHWDSYPTGLGVKVATDLRQVLQTTEMGELRDAVEKLRLVRNGSARPTPREIEQYRKFSDLGVSEQSETDWYCLLRNLQGEPFEALLAGIMLDAGDEWPRDSLFCEWGYLIDLDEEVFEIYEGFRKSPPTAGRWAGEIKSEAVPSDSDNRYYAVQRVKTIPLDRFAGENPPTDDEIFEIMKSLEYNEEGNG